MSVICDTLNERLRRDSQPKAARGLLSKASAPLASLENISNISRLNGVASSHASGDAYDLSMADEPINTGARARPHKQITVLLAEDRTIVREGMCALLDADDHISVTAQTSDSAEALTLAEQFRPDVVIVSIRLALRAGLESFRRNIESRSGARVLVLVPHNDNNMLTGHVASSGAAGSITEQTSSLQLAAAVRAAFWSNSSPDGAAIRPAVHSTSTTASERDVARLTFREREVLQFIAEGNGNKQTASKLNISVKTVEKHRQSIMDKLGIHETATLTRYAMYAGLVQ